jgi:DNA-directed RNA polymerase subunit RPC12/RpoP
MEQLVTENCPYCGFKNTQSEKKTYEYWCLSCNAWKPNKEDLHLISGMSEEEKHTGWIRAHSLAILNLGISGIK